MIHTALSGNSNLSPKVRYLAVALFIFSAFGIQAKFALAQANATPRVTRVSGELRLGKTIDVGIENLSSWSAQHDPHKLVPYLDGHALKGVYPEILDTSQNRLQFHLLRTEAAKPVWSTLFEHPGLQRSVAVSVGLEDQGPFQTVFDYEHPLPLTVIPKRPGIIALVVTVAVFSLAIGLMITTNIIRQSGPRFKEKKRPYDLGRFLILFWSTIIATTYFSVWLITGDSNVPATALALIGFSSTVVLAGYAAQTGPEEVSDSSSTATTHSLSLGFLTDILSDSKDYRFHRFQLVLWNLLLGFIFLFLTWEHLALPDFSRSLLALVGISTSIHLGFNLLERPRCDVFEGGRL